MGIAEAQDHEQFMQRALQLAKRAGEMGEVPVGAVLVRQGEVIGTGWNQPIASHDPSAHAEIVCLRDAARFEENYRLPNSTLYVTVEPCTMCFGALVHARVATLVYGASEPRAGVAGSQKDLSREDFYNHKIEVIGGVLEDECSTLMKEFFASKR